MKIRFALLSVLPALLPYAAWAALETCDKIPPEERVRLPKTVALEKYCIYHKRALEGAKVAEQTNASMKTLIDGSICRTEADKLKIILAEHFEIKDPPCK